MAYCKRNESLVSKGNCIVFIGDGEGSVGYCTYQPNDFIGSSTISAGYNNKLNSTNALFFIAVLDKERYRYSFGRKYRQTKVKATKIKLPATKEGKPDWDYIEKFVKEYIIPKLPKKSFDVWNNTLDTSPIIKEKISLNTDNWKWFKVGDLFEIELSKGDIKYGQSVQGNIPLISAGESNNGIVGYIDKVGDGIAGIFEGNNITIDMFCNTYYQKDKFYSVSHGRVNILIPKFTLNKYHALFIITLINREKYKYSYGRAVYSDESANITIKLPAKNEGGPDWIFMEKFIKSLPYSRMI